MSKNILIPITWTGLIIYFSLKPQSTTTSSLLSIDGMDKVVHCICYLILSLFWLIYFCPTRDNKNLFYKLFFAFSLFGILIEVLQGLMPLGRDCDGYDMVANTIGLAVGLMLYKKYFI